MINILLQLYIFTGLGLYLSRIFSQNIANINWQKIFGESFFIGVFLVVLVNNTIQLFALHVPQNGLWYLALTLATISFVYYFWQIKDRIIKEFKFYFKFNWLYFFFFIIAFLHLYYIVEQNQNMPLTSWDAWNGWIAKAKIWYFHGINEVLLNRTEWLLSDDSFTNITAHYPDGLPLLYVFNSGFFEWDEIALNAIYPAMFIGLCVAFYGNIKILINEKYALAAVLIFITIPFVNVHISLAGYADIWVAAFLVLSVFNLQHFLTNPKIKTFSLVIIMVVAMLMFKLISWVWVLILILVLALCLINSVKRRWMYIIIAVSTALWFLIGGLDFNTPFGQIAITPELIKIPALGSYKLTFMNTTSAWIEALFVSKNWNLLWYSIPFLVFVYFRLKEKEAVALPVIYLMFSTVFLFVLFYMTYNSVFANDFTSSNRVILHIVPVYIYFAFQLFYQYQKQKIFNSK